MEFFIPIPVPKIWEWIELFPFPKSQKSFPLTPALNLLLFKNIAYIWSFKHSVFDFGFGFLGKGIYSARELPVIRGLLIIWSHPIEAIHLQAFVEAVAQILNDTQISCISRKGLFQETPKIPSFWFILLKHLGVPCVEFLSQHCTYLIQWWNIGFKKVQVDKLTN